MRSKKIRLLNVREETTAKQDTTGTEEEEKTTYATVYVDKNKLKYFIDKIEEYANKNYKDSENPKNQKLINSISEIKATILSPLSSL